MVKPAAGRTLGSAQLPFLGSQLAPPPAELSIATFFDEQSPEFAAARPNWRYETLAPHMGLPDWARPEATSELLEGFWRRD